MPRFMINERTGRLMRAIATGAVTSLCLAALPVAAHAYSALYVFGDSLSDVGNVFVGTGGAEPASPYFDGRFSNGPIWADDLSASLGLGALKPSLLGGTDYAFGSATTSNPSTASSMVPTLTQQVGLFLTATGGSAPSSALYSVWIGGSDMLNLLESGTTGVTALTEAQEAAQSAAADIGTLIDHGARRLLVPLLPDIGASPAATAAGLGGDATLLSLAYNASLEAAIAGLGSVPGLDISYLDTFSLVDAIVADPAGFGLTNVTEPCYVGPYTGGGSVCADPDGYLFWDADHPTASGGAAIAAVAEALVPEPGTMGVFVTGLVGLAFTLRRRRDGRRTASLRG
ncbi:MAG: SGNH/GDSL hydrolase family protein [Acetobacteraceae bacterium]